MVVAQASSLLVRGQPMAALQIVGVRSDPHARAVRGLALAQLGELGRAKTELGCALKAFEEGRQALWVAKARAALAELQFATRDLEQAIDSLDGRSLRELGDDQSAAYVELQKARALALVGRRDEARHALESLAGGLAAAQGAARVIAEAELAALDGAFSEAAARLAGVGGENPLLVGEARRLLRALTEPSLELIAAGMPARPVALAEVEAILARGPVVDVMRRRYGEHDLGRKGAGLELLVALARGPVTAESLWGRSSESLAVRLRMEISRLRQALGLRIERGADGYACPGLTALVPRGSDGGVAAALADGESWSARSLAVVLGKTPRSIEREIEAAGPGVVREGRGAQCRYRLSGKAPGLAMQLLLLARSAGAGGSLDAVPLVIGVGEETRG
jgi:hypothetical protein